MRPNYKSNQVFSPKSPEKGEKLLFFSNHPRDQERQGYLALSTCLDTMTAMVVEETPTDDSEIEEEVGENQKGEEVVVTEAQISAPTLSKSWSIASAHVPTYTGGKVIHCHTKGMRYLHGKNTSTATVTEGDGDDDSSEQDNVPPEKTPFLLLPVGGDLALVDARRGIKARTIRHGALSPTAVSSNNTSGNKGDDDNDIIDDEDDDGIDADAITAFALSNNDDMIVTCSPNHLIRMYSLELPWDISQPAPIQKTWGRSGHSLPVTHMEFHPSNVFLATGSVDGTVRVWDVRGAYVTHVFRPYGNGGGSSSMGGMQAVTALSWRQDVSQLILAIGRDNGSIVIHNLRDDEATTPPIVLNDHVSAVTCLDWGKGSSAMNHVFVSTGRDAVINTWKVVQQQDADTSLKKYNNKQSKKKGNKRRGQVNYQRIYTLPIYEQVEGMIMMPFDKEKPNDLVIATAGSEGTVRLWRATVDEEHDTISGFSPLAKQPESESFGSDRGGYMELRYNPRGLSFKDEKGASPSSTTSIPSSLWMEQLIVADAEHNLSFLSAKATTDDSIASTRPLLSSDRTIVGHNDEILDLKVIPPSSQQTNTAPSSERIVVATNSAQVRLFELGTYSCEVLDGHSATVLCVDASPCGRYLATCGKDKTMRLWHLETQRCIAVATGHTEAIGAAALSRKVGRYDVKGKAAINGGGSFAVTASKDRTLKRWNLPGSDDLNKCALSEDPLELRAFVSARAHEKDINIISVAPNDSLVATGSQDKTVKLWRSTDLTLQGTLKGHRRGVWDCQFSPFDRVIATASADRTVKLWSLSDYSCVRTFQGHVSSALRVRFLSGGLQLVSSGADGLIKVWTIRTNECETTMDGHSDKVWALDLSPGSGSLVTGGADSQIVVWNDTTQEEESAKRDAEEQTIMMEQRLANHLRFKEYEQALEIALELDKPRQALKVLNSIIENDLQQGRGQLVTLKRHVQSWPMSRTSQVLRYCREWNTRARNSHVAMLVVKSIISSIPAHELAAADGVPELMAGITPYAERHFDRLDRLHASSYLLDFTLFSMGAMDNTDEDGNLETDYAAWEASSKFVLPPKHIDGRIQVGGKDLVGETNANQDDSSEDGDDSENEVLTVGESDADESSSSEDDDSSVDDDNDDHVQGNNDSDESSESSSDSD